MSVEKIILTVIKVSLHEREERIQGKKIRNEKKQREEGVQWEMWSCGKGCTGQMKW